MSKNENKSFVVDKTGSYVGRPISTREISQATAITENKNSISSTEHKKTDIINSGCNSISNSKNQTGKRIEIPVIESLLSGGLAGACAKTIIAPFDRIKILYQVSSTRKFTLNSAFRSAVKILDNEGLRGLWRGNTATMVRVIPYASILFFSYDFYENFYVYFSHNETSVLSRFLTGSLAGMTATTCTYPLDLIRARMACNQGRTARKIDFLKQIRTVLLSNEGQRGLYKGLSPTLMGHLPYSGLSFAIFETLKKRVLIRFKNGDDQFQTAPRLICGGLAGVLSQSATYPLDIIRRRMQVDYGSNINHPHYTSSFDAFKSILRTEGLRQGLYKGLSMNQIKGPIAVGVSFTVHDYIKVQFVSRYSSKEENMWIGEYIRYRFFKTS